MRCYLISKHKETNNFSDGLNFFGKKSIKKFYSSNLLQALWVIKNLFDFLKLKHSVKYLTL